MDDYSKILEKEKKLLNKENLLDDTIVENKLSKHEIISKMLSLIHISEPTRPY